MKRIFTAVILSLLFVILFASSGFLRVSSAETNKIKTYRDIPDISPQEIEAIENLKKSGRTFTYAALPSTEAFVSRDGSYNGFTPLLCEFLTELFEMEFKVVLREWDEIMGYEDDKGKHIPGGLELIEIDFTGELTPTEERVKKGYIMSLPITERLLRIFKNPELILKTEKDLNGLTLGFLEKTTTEDDIRRVYPKLTFKSINTVANYKMAVDLINLGSKNGGIDAFVDEAPADPAFDEYRNIRSKLFFTLVNSPVSLTTLNPDLKSIVSVFDKYLAAGGMKKLHTLYYEGDFRYAKNKLFNLFEDHEKEYLKNAAPVSIAYEYDNYPTNFYNSKEKRFQGIAVDILAQISKLTDLEFKPIHGKYTWKELLERFKKDEFQMSGQFLRTGEREKLFLFSDIPYASCYYAIVSRSDFPDVSSYQVANTPVGIMAGTGRIDAFKRFFGSDNLVTFPYQFDCIDALEKGEVDLIMGSEYTLLAQTNYREKIGLRINFKLDETLDSYFGFNKEEKILRDIINKAQAFVNTNAIETAWMGKSFDYSKKLTEQRAMILTISLSIILTFFGATILLFIKTLKMDAKLREAANTDSLTGIFNRRHFLEVCLTHIERSLRTENESFVIIFDLDHFKKVNDTYGHLAGDKVLKETTQRVKKVIRPYDVFGRYGGEEFIIFMPELDKKDVLAAAERIRKEICAAPVEFEDMQIPVSASLGIAYATPVIKEIDIATKHADQALYRAKEGGRNRVEFYGEEFSG
ncbi:MAG: diguanylate cyclase [Chitinispirillales bacterium]|jgi:diguanylate cyclase (GGDEF)-like protein|nr:diguanylate cyclase [Chitinispirillales bacterium]